MKNRMLTLAGTLALLAVLGKFYARPVLAQVRAALVQDVDQPARAPFQVVVPINVTNFTSTPVSIPSGKRLVIEFVNMSCGASAANNVIQPIGLISSTVAGNSPVNFYMAPTVSPTDSGQFYQSWPVSIYADSPSVSPALAGYEPSFLACNVAISGHLITP